MPPSTEDRLTDIIEAIANIEKTLAGLTRDEFTSDLIRRMATERFLEIVCEAARRLPDEIKQAAPDFEWRKMVDFANRLRHAYHETDIEIVWDIIQNDLPPLKSLVEARIRGAG